MILLSTLLFSIVSASHECPSDPVCSSGSPPTCPSDQFLVTTLVNGCWNGCYQCQYPPGLKTCPALLCTVPLTYCDSSQGLQSFVYYAINATTGCFSCPHQMCVPASSSSESAPPPATIARSSTPAPVSPSSPSASSSPSSSTPSSPSSSGQCAEQSCPATPSCTNTQLLMQPPMVNGCAYGCLTCKSPAGSCSPQLCPLNAISCQPGMQAQTTFPFTESGCPLCPTQTCVTATTSTSSTSSATSMTTATACTPLVCAPTPTCNGSQVLVQNTDSNNCPSSCPTCVTPTSPSSGLCPSFLCPYSVVFCDPTKGLMSQVTYTQDPNGCIGCGRQTCVPITSTASSSTSSTLPASSTLTSSTLASSSLSSTTTTATQQAASGMTSVTPTATSSSSCPSSIGCAPQQCRANQQLVPGYVDANGCEQCSQCVCSPGMPASCGAAPVCTAPQILANQYDDNNCNMCQQCVTPSASCNTNVACPTYVIFCDPALNLTSQLSYNLDSNGCPGCPIQMCVSISSTTSSSSSLPSSTTPTSTVASSSSSSSTTPNCPPINCPLIPASCPAGQSLTTPTDANGCKTCPTCTTTTSGSSSPSSPSSSSCPSVQCGCILGGQPVYSMDANGCPTCTCQPCTEMACTTPECGDEEELSTPVMDEHGCPGCQVCQPVSSTRAGGTSSTASTASTLRASTLASSSTGSSTTRVSSVATAATTPVCKPVNCPFIPSSCPVGQTLTTPKDVNNCAQCPSCTTCPKLACSTTPCPDGTIMVAGSVNSNGCATCGQCQPMITANSAEENEANHASTVVLSALTMLATAVLFLII